MLRSLANLEPFAPSTTIYLPNGKGAVDTLHYDEIRATNVFSGSVPDAYPVAVGLDCKTLAAIYEQSPVIQRAVRIGAAAIRLVGIKVILRRQGGKSVEARSGQPYKMLRYVNPNLGPSGLLATMYSDESVFGSGYAAIEPAPNGYERFTEFCLYPMRPDYVKVVPDPDTKVAVYIYDNGTDKFYFPASRVCHFTDYSPTNHYMASSPINSVTYDLQVEKYAKRGLRNFHSQAAVISGIITSKDTIGEDEIRRIKREFYEQYAGAKNAYRVLVLEKDMQYSPLKPSGVDSYVSEVIKDAQLNQAMVMGVPMGLLRQDTPSTGVGEVDKLESLFWRTTLLPWLVKAKDELDKKLCMAVESVMPMSKATTIEIMFDTSKVHALKRENLDEMRTFVAAVTSGLSSPNEIREARGDDPWPDEFKEFADAPFPYYKQSAADAAASAAADASSSLTLPGSQGGRDQSASGETQLIDQTGQRSISEETLVETIAALVEQNKRS